MFRDLKEYQEIAKIYAEKVSKPENLEENQANRMKMKQQRTAQNKGRFEKQIAPLKPKPIQGRISPSSQNMAGKPKPMPTTAEIRAKNHNVVPGTRVNEVGAKGGGKPSSGDLSMFKDKKPEISKFTKQGKERTPAQMAAAKRIGSGTAKNPDTTIAQVKQSNQDSMRARAKERFAAFKAKRAEKKAAMVADEVITPYDIVLEYLLSSKQAATIEEANYVMTEMDAETIQGIVEEQKKIFDEGLGCMILKTGAAIGGALLAKKGLGDMKKKFDNYLNKQRDKGIGGNTRPGSDKMYYGDKK